MTFESLNYELAFLFFSSSSSDPATTDHVSNQIRVVGNLYSLLLPSKLTRSEPF